MTTLNTPNPNTPKTIETDLNHLIKEQEKWFSAYYERSNKKLYSVLSGCLALYYRVRKSKNELDDLNEIFATRGITQNVKTPLASKIIRAVFGSDRHRAYVYSQVLREAEKQHVLPANLATWISDKGGIEEIRRPEKPASLPAQSKTDKYQNSALEYLSSAPSRCSIDEVAFADLKISSQSEFVIAVVRLNANRPAEIVELIHDQAIKKYVFNHIGKINAEARQAADSTAELEQKFEAQQSAIRAIAAKNNAAHTPTFNA